MHLRRLEGTLPGPLGIYKINVGGRLDNTNYFVFCRWLGI